MLFVLSNPFAKFTVHGVGEDREEGGSGCYCTGGLTSNASSDLLSLLVAFDFPYVFVARLNANRSLSLYLFVCVASVHHYYSERERRRACRFEGDYLH